MKKIIMMILVGIPMSTIMCSDIKYDQYYSSEEQKMKAARHEYDQAREELDRLVAKNIDENSVHFVLRLLAVELQLVDKLMRAETGGKLDALLTKKRKLLESANGTASYLYKSVMKFATNDILLTGKNGASKLGSTLHGSAKKTYLKRMKKVLSDYRNEFLDKQYDALKMTFGSPSDRCSQYVGQAHRHDMVRPSFHHGAQWRHHEDRVEAAAPEPENFLLYDDETAVATAVPQKAQPQTMTPIVQEYLNDRYAGLQQFINDWTENLLVLGTLTHDPITPRLQRASNIPKTKKVAVAQETVIEKDSPIDVASRQLVQEYLDGRHEDLYDAITSLTDNLVQDLIFTQHKKEIVAQAELVAVAPEKVAHQDTSVDVASRQVVQEYLDERHEELQDVIMSMTDSLVYHLMSAPQEETAVVVAAQPESETVVQTEVVAVDEETVVEKDSSVDIASRQVVQEYLDERHEELQDVIMSMTDSLVYNLISAPQEDDKVVAQAEPVAAAPEKSVEQDASVDLASRQVVQEYLDERHEELQDSIISLTNNLVHELMFAEHEEEAAVVVAAQPVTVVQAEPVAVAPEKVAKQDILVDVALPQVVQENLETHGKIENLEALVVENEITADAALQQPVDDGNASIWQDYDFDVFEESDSWVVDEEVVAEVASPQKVEAFAMPEVVQEYLHDRHASLQQSIDDIAENVLISAVQDHHDDPVSVVQEQAPVMVEATKNVDAKSLARVIPQPSVEHCSSQQAGPECAHVAPKNVANSARPDLTSVDKNLYDSIKNLTDTLLFPLVPSRQ
jgi:hypothetical protein